MEVFLISGGAGFIGLNFIKYLHNNVRDAFIVNVDKLTYAANLIELGELEKDKNYIFMKEDICNKIGLENIFKTYKPDYVVNFAAESHVDRSIEDSDVFINTNVMGLHTLLQCSLKSGIKRFVQISTDEVYGATTGEIEFSELSLLKPGNPYAASKAAGDMLALSYFNTYKLPIMITRSTNNYGAYQNKEKLIPLVIDRCMKNQGIPLYGDGLHRRDWLYVKDHCEAIYQVLRKGKLGEIYNISAGNEIENRLLIKKIIEICKAELKAQGIPGTEITDELIKYIADRKGHDRRYKINSDKTRKDLGWKPCTDFELGLENTIKWYLKNKE